ncbi:hypothetical protein [Sulfurimonas sp.]|uniref:hypothetical protein n=1 Tax=Sulfurimonas sp. TaxID=2022749 RepID=UPI002AAFC0F4|nr:hypothetical protein [Sulfurimonas sp.]
MQVNFSKIQRPTLFQEFFDKLITYSNEVIEYIHTSTINLVTPTYRKTAITLMNIIKNNIKHSYISVKAVLTNLFKRIIK